MSKGVWQCGFRKHARRVDYDLLSVDANTYEKNYCKLPS